MAKRWLNEIIVHCSASDKPAHDDISVIDRWHRERGWSEVGYHFFIRNNGQVQKGRWISKQGAHCSGHNTHSVGVCLSGDRKFQADQFASLNKLIHKLRLSYPSITLVSPHNKYTDKKTSPNFPVKQYNQIIIGDQLCVLEI